MEIREVPGAVTWLQIRSDMIGDVPADWLRSCFAGNLLYTLRSPAHGGKFGRSSVERHRRLVEAAKDYDLVELEFDSDMQPELLDAIPAFKRMITWRGDAEGVSHLQARFQQIAAVPARFYCMITSASRTGEGLQPLVLLKTLNRSDVVAFADGPSGLWSQLLAPWMGSPLLFGLSGGPRIPGQLLIQDLISDYGFPAIRPLRKVYGIAGNRIFQSPSPRLHNAAYRMLGHPAIFLPFHVEHFEEFWKDVLESGTLESLGVPVSGLVIVSPHKEAAVAAADIRSSMVRKAGSSNVFVRRNGAWAAETTDHESISGVRDLCPLRAAVIGCGGAGRAVAAALRETGSDVTLVNRGVRRGAYAVELLGLPFVPLSEFRARGFNLIVNATPVGKDNDTLPLVIDSLGGGTVVVELAYGSQPTPLVSAALARGGSAIDGYEVLLTQVRKQFELLTGMKMPAAIGRETALNGAAEDLLASGAALQAAGGPREIYECSF